MKCLSIKQPFARLIVSGKKKIEIRSWKTWYRGELILHASKVPDKEAIKRFEFNNGDLVCGAIIGKVMLVDCKDYKTDADFIKDETLI